MIICCLLLLLTSSLFSSQWLSRMAFLQLLPLAVSSADLLPAPTLSADPAYDVYYEGEYVTLQCKALTQKPIGGFRFFSETGEQVYLRAPYSLPTTVFEFMATKASAGKYTCMYFLEDFGQEISSSRSLPFSVKVQDAPMAPTLSLDPQQQVYRRGNYVKILCSIPSTPEYVTEFQYSTSFGQYKSIPVSNATSYSYKLSITGQEVSGSYSCAYFVIKSERPVRSESSPWISVNVKNYESSWIREVIVGGSFFTINGLIFFFSHRLMKKREGQD